MTIIVIIIIEKLFVYVFWLFTLPFFQLFFTFAHVTSKIAEGTQNGVTLPPSVLRPALVPARPAGCIAMMFLRL